MSDTDSERGIVFRYELSDDERMLLIRGLLRLRPIDGDSRLYDLMDKLLDDKQAVW